MNAKRSKRRIGAIVFTLALSVVAIDGSFPTAAAQDQQDAPVGGIPVPGPNQPSFGEQALTAFQRATAAPRTAIIDATLDAANGELSRPARVDGVRVIRSYAPKEFARDQGDWVVALFCERNCDGSQPQTDDPQFDDRQGYDPTTGAPVAAARDPRAYYADNTARRLRAYRVLNPLHDIERETDGRPGAVFLFEPVRWSGPYKWELIVPLYDQAGPMPVDRIEVREIATERLVLETRLPRGR